MGKVRGPFIEYECSKCDVVIRENANMPRHQLSERIAEVSNAKDITCAGCSDWANSEEDLK